MVNSNKTTTIKSFKYRTKIIGITPNDVEDLDVVITMYNPLEYNDNYSMTSGGLWNYYRDEINDDKKENDANENMVNSNKTTTIKSFKYMTKIIESTPNSGKRLNAEVVVPLKYLSNFWRSVVCH